MLNQPNNPEPHQIRTRQTHLGRELKQLTPTMLRQPNFKTRIVGHGAYIRRSVRMSATHRWMLARIEKTRRKT
jgi:hypothetical protein